MRFILSALLAMAFGSGALAQEARVDRIEIVGKGLYRIEVGASIPDANLPGGALAPPTQFTNIETTSTVAARIGTEFGFEYRIVGEPDGAEVTLEFVNTYPAPGLADPESPTPFMESKYERSKKIGETIYSGYGLENDWELVPGTWIFEIRHKGDTLASVSFTLVK